jgi:predicted DNA-binding transcriptional regulator AlpA
MPQALFTDMENSFNKIKEQIVCTPKEVAHYLGKSVSWVYKNQSELGVRKLGGSLFFPEKEELYERLFGKGKGLEVRLHPEWNQVHKGMVSAKTRRRQGGNRKKGGAKESGAGDRSAGDANRHGLLGAS